MGLDRIGHRSSKSTFGAYNFTEQPIKGPDKERNMLEIFRTPRAKNVTGMIFMQSKTTKTLKIAFAEEQKRRRARAKNVTEKMYRLSNAI